MRWCARRTCGCCGASWKAARRRTPEPTQIKCGSGLARESVVSVNPSVADPPHSRASPLPH
ncbi:hypothetical protein C0058_32075 [Pseudomonas sp. NC02]|nr:hypothetical protein C0058_32075 [Pseudomonas sp. NC02]